MSGAVDVVNLVARRRLKNLGQSVDGEDDVVVKDVKVPRQDGALVLNVHHALMDLTLRH